MSKHTKAPWNIPDDSAVDILHSSGARMIRVNPVHGHISIAEMQANRRLIAAAPDLLAALKAISEFWAYGMSKPDDAVPTAEDEARVVQLGQLVAVAIQKAEGL